MTSVGRVSFGGEGRARVEGVAGEKCEGREGGKMALLPRDERRAVPGRALQGPPPAPRAPPPAGEGGDTPPLAFGGRGHHRK